MTLNSSTRRAVGAGALVAGLALSACTTSGGEDGADATTTGDKATTSAVATTEEATTTTSATEGVGDRTYTSTSSGYAFPVLDAWDGPMDRGGARFWYVADPEDGFQPNVNVLTQEKGDQDLESYVSATESGLDTVLEDPRMVRSSVTTRGDGVRIGAMEYTGSAEGQDLHFSSTVIVSGDRFVLATFTSPADRYDELIGDVQPSLDALSPA